MLSKSQESKKNCYSPLLFTQSARSAWKFILQHFAVKEPYKILLPPYIGITDREGSGIFDPVRETKTPFDFYLLDKKLGVDLVFLEKMLAGGQYKILMLAHYFGFCRTDLKKLKMLCDQNGVILVEDCAHALGLHQGISQLGAIGDFSVYSLHKFLPMEKGGILRVNNPNFALPDIDPKAGLESGLVQFYAGFDLHQVLGKRLENYRFLYGMLVNEPGIEIMYDLQEGDLPHDFPVLVKNGLREKLYFLLIEMGVPTTALYYRLIDEIKIRGFEKMQKISNNILNLPIHQDVDAEDLALMAEKIKMALKQLNQ
jgi:dTDP-4-amino-4,6-dideoxygalactose transaminase